MNPKLNKHPETIDSPEYLSGLEACKLNSRFASNISRMSLMGVKLLKSDPANEQSKGGKLLVRAGYMNKTSSGIYTFLPLGLKVQQKVEEIVRNEMLSLNSQEVVFPALQPSRLLKETGRWGVDVLFRIEARAGKEFCLAFTHEENCAEYVGQTVKSYKDLPVSVFQIQTKFRDEARARSGILRGKEFRMKDMYSFHTNQGDLDSYFNEAHKAYMRIFSKLGIGDSTYLTLASGGDYTKYSYEYQTVCDAGEDVIYVCKESGLAINKEIFDEVGRKCPLSGSTEFEECRSAESGNIFKLGTRFTDAYNHKYVSSEGKQEPIYMASYGIGITRTMGVIAELLSDDNGLVWPEVISPFQVHALCLSKNEEMQNVMEGLLDQFSRAGISVLYDDRHGQASSGEMLKGADLIGIPNIITLGNRSFQKNVIELKNRTTGKVEEVPFDNLVKRFL